IFWQNGKLDRLGLEHKVMEVVEDKCHGAYPVRLPNRNPRGMHQHSKFVGRSGIYGKAGGGASIGSAKNGDIPAGIIEFVAMQRYIRPGLNFLFDRARWSYQIKGGFSRAAGRDGNCASGDGLRWRMNLRGPGYTRSEQHSDYRDSSLHDREFVS